MAGIFCVPVSVSVDVSVSVSVSICVTLVPLNTFLGSFLNFSLSRFRSPFYIKSNKGFVIRFRYKYRYLFLIFNILSLFFFFRLQYGSFCLYPFEDIDSELRSSGLKIVIKTRIDFTAVNHKQDDRREYGYAQRLAECGAYTAGYQYPANIIDQLVNRAAYGSTTPYMFSPFFSRLDSKFGVGDNQTECRQ